MNILLSRVQALAFFALFWVAWFSAAIGGPVEAFNAPKKTVLVLYGDPLSIPSNRMIEQGLTAALLSAHAWALEVFSEYLDLARFPAARYGDDIVRYLRARYGTRKPDVLITVTNTALQFVLDHRDELFPDVPIVFTAVDHREVEDKEMPPNVAGLWTAWDYQRTLELALQLQPKTREVVCVAGTGVEDQAYNDEARKVLERFATDVRVRWLDKLPLLAMLDEVARLPLDSVVLYIPMLRDGAGQSVSPFEVARQLVEASRVPVYGLARPQLEQGIIGGALVDFSEIGSKTAALALRVLAGERLPVLSAPNPAIYALLINWPALKKWHVSESRIPEEATVLYRDPSLWVQHPRLILATSCNRRPAVTAHRGVDRSALEVEAGGTIAARHRGADEPCGRSGGPRDVGVGHSAWQHLGDRKMSVALWLRAERAARFSKVYRSGASGGSQTDAGSSAALAANPTRVRHGISAAAA